MKTQYDYYLPKKGGKTWKLISDFIKERQAAYNRRVAFRDEQGAQGMYGHEGALIGLVFETTPPKVWQRDIKASNTEHSVYVPNKRTKEGRELAAKMGSEQMAFPNAMHFNLRVCPDMESFGVPQGESPRGTIIEFVHYTIINDQFILIVPRDGEGNVVFTPEKDCKPLKQSEYWAMKEKEELTKK